MFNDPLEKIKGKSLAPFELGGLSGSNVIVLCALVLFLILLVGRISRYLPIVRDRIIAVSIFGLFTVFFFAFFEQSLGSMTLFARDYTNRTLVSKMILDALPESIALVFTSLFLAALIGIPIGVYASQKPNGTLDTLLRILTSFGLAVPSFVAAILIAWLLGYLLNDYLGLPITGSL